MILGELNAQYIRDTYLIGFPLGPAWDGPAGDTAMTNILIGVIADVESKMGIRFKRTVLKTDPDPGLILGEDFDQEGERLHYFPPLPGVPHYFIPLPFNNVVSIDRVRLFYGNTVVTTIPEEWISFTSKEGYLRIMPLPHTGLFMNTVVGFTPFLARHGTPDVVPHSWSIDATYGYGQIDADIARYIGLTAAIQILGLHPLAHGLSSESLSQDGITESVSYYQGPYGPFSGAVQMLKDELKSMDIFSKRASKKGIKVSMW